MGAGAMGRVALALVPLLIAGCQAETPPIALPLVVAHHNGLQVHVIDQMSVNQTRDGFVFDDSRAVRQPLRLSIELRRGDDQVPVARWYFGLFGPREAIRPLGQPGNQGSGGQSYGFEAWKPSGRCWIVVQSSQQAEDGVPSFGVARAVLEAATTSTGSGCDAAVRTP